jgi:hypothetical protein
MERARAMPNMITGHWSADTRDRCRRRDVRRTLSVPPCERFEKRPFATPTNDPV